MENNNISENTKDKMKCIILLCGEMAKILKQYLDLQDAITKIICEPSNFPRTNYCVSQKPPIIVKILNGDFDETKGNIRITPQSFQKLLEFFPGKRHGWKKEIELIVFLFWLGCGTSYRVSKAMVIPKSTVRNIIHKYLNIFEKMSNDIVQKTPPITALEEIGQKFATKARSEVFKKAVGAIDGCHVKIKCPPNQRVQYINRKLDYSIQLQAVCDANYKIINMCVGYPGSVHDQRVLINSRLYRTGHFPPMVIFNWEVPDTNVLLTQFAL